jgi:hypothetical protein
MPLDEHIEGGHGEREPSVKIRPAPVHDSLEMADDSQHREHRLDEHTVLPLSPLTQFEIARIPLGGMEGGIAQDEHASVNLAPSELCFASKVGHFASKIDRLASKRHKWHLERASGNALQALAKGPYDTISALSSGLSSPKNLALSQRLAVIVIKVDRQEQQQPFLAPILAPKLFVSASVFAAKLWGKLCDLRPRFLATFSRHAGDVQRRQQARNSLQPFYCRKLAACRMKGLSGLRRRPTFVVTSANLPGKAQEPPGRPASSSDVSGRDERAASARGAGETTRDSRGSATDKRRGCPRF